MSVLVGVSPTAGSGRWPKDFLRGTVLLVLLLLPASRLEATTIQGTAQFQGEVQLAPSMSGISVEDVVVSVKDATAATGGGEHCEILSISSDNADANGAFPNAGVVSVDIEISVGSPTVDPQEACIVMLKARANDGGGGSARGWTTAIVNAAEIESGATVIVPDPIVLREAKAIAELDKTCGKWVRGQLKKRDRCNDLILRKGALIAVDRCRDAGFPEPAMCDPGDGVEATLALGHGSNDQQTDVAAGEAVDPVALKEQVKCQKRFGRQAAVSFAIKRSRLVAKKCVERLQDSQSCRDHQSGVSRRRLDKIDKCIVAQGIDGTTGRLVPDVGPPCGVCVDPATGDIDRECMKSCFQLVLDEVSDIIVGNIPECGDGLCSATIENCVSCPEDCTTETAMERTCDDGLDNDCDTLADTADPDCQPRCPTGRACCTAHNWSDDSCFEHFIGTEPLSSASGCSSFLGESVYCGACVCLPPVKCIPHPINPGPSLCHGISVSHNPPRFSELDFLLQGQRGVAGRCADWCPLQSANTTVDLGAVDVWEAYIDGQRFGPVAGFGIGRDFSLSSGEHVLAARVLDTSLSTSPFSALIGTVEVDGLLVAKTGDGSWRAYDGVPSGSWWEVNYDDTGWGVASPCAAEDIPGSLGSGFDSLLDDGAQWVLPRSCTQDGESVWRLRFTVP